MNRKVLPVAPLLSLVLVSSCASTKDWSEADWKLAQLGISPEEHKASLVIDDIWRTYVQQVLYVGMPEEEFLKQFTKSNTWNDPDRPYIIQQSSHSYVFLQAPRYGQDKGRVTFVSGALIKYEQFGLGENPFGYTDCTFLLRPAKDVPARWESL